jgi:hypothetical protein
MDCGARTYAEEGMVSCAYHLTFPASKRPLTSSSPHSLAWKHRQRHPLLPYPGP